MFSEKLNCHWWIVLLKENASHNFIGCCCWYVIFYISHKIGKDIVSLFYYH